MKALRDKITDWIIVPDNKVLESDLQTLVPYLNLLGLMGAVLFLVPTLIVFKKLKTSELSLVKVHVKDLHD